MTNPSTQRPLRHTRAAQLSVNPKGHMCALGVSSVSAMIRPFVTLSAKSTPAGTRTRAHGLGNRCSIRLSYRGTQSTEPSRPFGAANPEPVRHQSRRKRCSRLRAEVAGVAGMSLALPVPPEPL